MDNSPASHIREELQEAFNVLYEESMKMKKRNMKFKNSFKKVTLENEA